MVNKCSVVGCKSLYIKTCTAKLHRFPLRNKKILPFWIAITGKQDWTPTHSSRLCSNHFVTSDYMLDHKKGLLKPTSVPSIKYKVKFPKYRRNITKSQKKQNNQETKINIKLNSSSNYDDYDDNRKNQSNVLTKNLTESLELITPTLSVSTIFEDFPSNWNNPSYFINDFTENIEYAAVISPTENRNGLFVREFQNIEKQIINSTFNEIMSLQKQKPRCTQTLYSLYFNSPKIRQLLS